MRLWFCEVIRALIVDTANFLVALLYGDFWKLRKKCMLVKRGFPHILYYAYLEAHSSWIGLKTKMGGGKFSSRITKRFYF